MPRTLTAQNCRPFSMGFLLGRDYAILIMKAPTRGWRCLGVLGPKSILSGGCWLSVPSWESCFPPKFMMRWDWSIHEEKELQRPYWENQSCPGRGLKEKNEAPASGATMMRRIADAMGTRARPHG